MSIFFSESYFAVKLHTCEMRSDTIHSVEDRQVKDAACSLALSLSAAILVVLLSGSTGETLRGEDPHDTRGDSLNTGDL